MTEGEQGTARNARRLRVLHGHLNEAERGFEGRICREPCSVTDIASLTGKLLTDQESTVHCLSFVWLVRAFGEMQTDDVSKLAKILGKPRVSLASQC